MNTFSLNTRLSPFM